MCDSSYKTISELKLHIKSKHLQINDHKCKLCPFKSHLLSRLKIHVKAVHAKVKDFVCEVCGLQFGENRILKDHKKAVHLNIRDHVCNICEKACPSASSLRSHEKLVHMREKKHACKECGTGYYERSDLKKHEKAAYLGACKENGATFTSLKPHKKKVPLNNKDHQKLNARVKPFQDSPRMKLHYESEHLKAMEVHKGREQKQDSDVQNGLEEETQNKPSYIEVDNQCLPQKVSIQPICNLHHESKEVLILGP